MDLVLTGWPFAGLGIALALLVILFAVPWAGKPWRARWSDARWLLWLAVPVYMLHQFEEHGIDLLGRPSAFRAYMCGTLGYRGPDLSACPADPVFLFTVNVGTVWIASVVGALTARRRVMVGFCGIAIPLVNAAVHILPALLRGAYNPGVATAAFIFVPFTAWVLHTFLRQGLVDPPRVALAVVLGIALHVSLIGSLFAASAGVIGRDLLLAIQPLNALVLVGVGLALRPATPT